MVFAPSLQHAKNPMRTKRHDPSTGKPSPTLQLISKLLTSRSSHIHWLHPKSRPSLVQQDRSKRSAELRWGMHHMQEGKQSRNPTPLTGATDAHAKQAKKTGVYTAIRRVLPGRDAAGWRPALTAKGIATRRGCINGKPSNPPTLPIPGLPAYPTHRDLDCCSSEA